MTMINILFAVSLAMTIAIVGCLLFEAATQFFFSDGEPRWTIAMGGAYTLAVTGGATLIFAALGGNI